MQRTRSGSRVEAVPWSLLSLILRSADGRIFAGVRVEEAVGCLDEVVVAGGPSEKSEWQLISFPEYSWIYENPPEPPAAERERKSSGEIDRRLSSERSLAVSVN